MKSSEGGAALYGGSGLASAAMLPPKAQKLSKMGTVQFGVKSLDVDDSISREDLNARDLDRSNNNSPNINAASIKLQRKGTFSSSSPNRRLKHMITKEAKLMQKIQKIKDKNQSQMSMRSFRSNSQISATGVAGHLRVSREVAEPSDLVQKMIEANPERARQLYELQSKPNMVLTEDELQVEQALLREKLKAVNKNLDRIVNKELILQQAAEGKERAHLKAIEKFKNNQEEVAQEVVLLEKQIENTNHRKKQLKLEYKELQGKMERHLGDSEAADKLQLQLQYLDSMIKGEYIQIKNLNEKIEKFIRYDFVQKEVDGERKLVQ